ncbi:helix-turn-helix transcriptional regulator [Sphingobacterium alkalisoli]|uniref:Helix-turn-helix transcriptional regulator n=3 Tax=Sphingobacterium TaxID=28453 RepID=A0A4U0H4K8_9SPHI|nr:helix-turn-helix domain-containing protein [Sphingobacterium alkalisoli]MBE8719154.1 transcriptional regulator [Sphingobacterium pedocola]TJY66647.1 helix-turn-helix transcriptional regulator [Sphingobacterium alkalisoli]GGH15089.1 transcriptional regulator [Sphingobacterium alkalisoli]
MGEKLVNGKISNECMQHFNSVKDALYVLEGKWSVLLIAALASGKKRYLELQRMVEGIGPKMLSKELSKLELNGLISRTQLNTKPITVEYELTEYGKSLQPLIDAIGEWGKEHREKIRKEISASRK